MQEPIAPQIFDPLADEEAWRKRFAEKRDIIRQMAHEAIQEDERAETRSLAELL